MDQPKSFQLSSDVHRYLLDHSDPIDTVASDLISRTAELGGVAMMQVAPEQALLLTILTRLVEAQAAVEVGTFTGLSALAIARGLAPGGRLLCCDVSEEWTALAQDAWARAGVADRIDLRIAPARETLTALPDEPTIDFAFIDADKPSYIDYFELLVPRLRTGGLLVVDNVLWQGRVVDPSVDDASTVAIRTFNAHAAADGRIDKVMLPVADGLLIARRR